MARLTKLEKEMLARAAHFALMGEWPWDDMNEDKKSIRKWEREKAALNSAMNKLDGPTS